MGFQVNDEEGINDINITPFVDVVLVLLVIFMITTPMMVRESLKVVLPKAVTSESSGAKQFGVSITKKGQVLINGRLVGPDALYAEMEMAYKENNNIEVLISADKEARHGDIIMALDQIKKVGIENFAFQIERVVKQ